MNDDVVRRTISRTIEALDDQRPIAPYSIRQVVDRSTAEPVIDRMLKELVRLDRAHPGWYLGDHVLRHMHTVAGGILRATDARGRRTHGRIQFKPGDPARFFTIVVFTLAQVQAMRVGGRKYERYVKLKNDDLEELEELMVRHNAHIVDEVYELWCPRPVEDRGVA
jgi:hypothetical protein